MKTIIASALLTLSVGAQAFPLVWTDTQGSSHALTEESKRFKSKADLRDSGFNPDTNTIADYFINLNSFSFGEQSEVQRERKVVRINQPGKKGDMLVSKLNGLDIDEVVLGASKRDVRSLNNNGRIKVSLKLKDGAGLLLESAQITARAVPEASSAFLLGLGMFSLLFCRRMQIRGD